MHFNREFFYFLNKRDELLDYDLSFHLLFFLGGQGGSVYFVGFINAYKLIKLILSVYFFNVIGSWGRVGYTWWNWFWLRCWCPSRCSKSSEWTFDSKELCFDDHSLSTVVGGYKTNMHPYNSESFKISKHYMRIFCAFWFPFPWVSRWM